MTGIILYRARLHVAGQVGFDSDLFFAQKFDQAGILWRRDGMPDPFSSQLADRLPNASWSSCLSGVYGDVPARPPRPLKMRDEKITWIMHLITRQVNASDVIFLS